MVATQLHPSNRQGFRIAKFFRLFLWRSFASSRVVHWEPRAVLRTACDALLNEIHPLHSIGHVWIKRVDSLDLLALRCIDHGVKRRRINIRKGFEERFWMPAWQTARSSTACIHVGSIWISRVDSMRLSILPDYHGVGIFLSPGQRSLGTVNFD